MQYWLDKMYTLYIFFFWFNGYIYTRQKKIPTSSDKKGQLR